MTLWEVDIYPQEGQIDPVGREIAAEAADLLGCDELSLTAGHGYLIQGKIDRQQIEQLAQQLLADAVVERTVIGSVGDSLLNEPLNGRSQLIHVMPKVGVMDPVADSAKTAIADCRINAEAVRTLHKYWLPDLPPEQVQLLCEKLLANDAIEQVVVGPLSLESLQAGSTYQFELLTVPLRELDDSGLELLSREGQLYLTLVEMQTIQAQFQQLGRDPTDVELESIAQTWSEHCSHKTLAGRISYRDESGERSFDNMLKETIFAATVEIRAALGDDDWCVSVFEDNAGIIRFDDRHNVVFKVETHNHPSALEPYGGANTGIGGVIRDPLGTGLGAKPVCNTDVFCFAPPDTLAHELPPGVLHPRRVMKGVVAGVRDYGNRMGIPTVNGAVYFDSRYLGNPLVYCGDVGILPREKSGKQPRAGDWVVAIGGRTGRDGIHGATFSSAELTSDSESVSGGAVQIGNAITEKMLLDVLLIARDQGLFSAVTDCGAGGFSSAVGEMGEHIGAEVWLDKAPLKYSGLSYTEIWISESQERMVLSVSPETWEPFEQLCSSEGVEATIIGRFVSTGRLQLNYNDQQVADLSMSFLHDGRPPVVREAVFTPEVSESLDIPVPTELDYTPQLLRILGSYNVASKHWVIRQYDHEVQGGSVIKPLTGANNDGPSDAAVVRPVLDSRRGLVVSCGMNPYYGDLDTYHMAASAIDEAVRNCVATGADPSQIAILDNFCWGYTDRPETLGSLVRAALACYDVAVGLQTPFISGKDSLNNEFSFDDADGQRQTIAIPPTLLISALGQIADVEQCVTMDLKSAGNQLYIVGLTRNEMGGSHFALVSDLNGGEVPKVDVASARQTFAALHAAILGGLVRACHDLSEGGLAVAAAEMAFAGGWGARLFLGAVPFDMDLELPTEQAAEQLARDMAAADFNPLGAIPEATAILLFSESNTRFLCEVPSERSAEFVAALGDIPNALVGEVLDEQRLEVVGLLEPAGSDKDDATATAPVVIDADLKDLKSAWQEPLDW